MSKGRSLASSVFASVPSVALRLLRPWRCVRCVGWKPRFLATVRSAVIDYAAARVRWSLSSAPRCRYTYNTTHTARIADSNRRRSIIYRRGAIAVPASTVLTVMVRAGKLGWSHRCKKRSRIFLKTLKNVTKIKKKTFVDVEWRTLMSTLFNPMPNT